MSWFSEAVETVCVVVGNTVGSFINWKCPKCGETSKINEYGGNAVYGATCPKCGQFING
jgi:ribosomal protein S27E